MGGSMNGMENVERGIAWNSDTPCEKSLFGMGE